MNTLEAGNVLSNRFRIERRIGEGEQTEVFHAFDITQNFPCAVKLINPSASDSRRRRFMREFEELSRLEHPYLIRAYDFVDDPQVGMFYSCELIDGIPIHAVYDSFHVERHLPLIIQICEIFKYLHGHAIIHGDIKPSSLLVTRSNSRDYQRNLNRRFSLHNIPEIAAQDEGRSSEGSIRLTGLGLMEQVPFSRDTSMREAFYYIAPEVVLGRKYDFSADIYSLGVIFYQLVTGELPYYGESLLSLVKNRLRLEPLSPHEINKDISPKLEHVVMKCLKRRPLDRYDSIEELLSDLSNVEQEVFFSRRQIRYPLYRLTSEFHNREAEREQFTRFMMNAEKSLGSMILLGGELGIGKTRFIQEIKTLAQLRGFLVFTSHCSDKFSYRMQPIVELIQQALLQLEKQFPEKIAAYGREQDSSEEGDSDFNRSESLNAESGVCLDYDDMAGGDKETRKLLESSCQLFTDLSRDVPLLLIIDDAHRADSGTISFLKLLADIIETSAILVAISFRSDLLEPMSEANPALHPLRQLISDTEKQSPITFLTLNRFSREQTSQLMKSLLDGALINSAFLDYCHEETDGIPGLVVELLHLLLQRGIIVQDEKGQFRIQEFDATLKPLLVSLQKDIEQRFQHLSDEERILLELFSIMQHGVERKVLAAIGGFDLQNVDVICKRLHDRELIKEREKNGVKILIIAQKQLQHFIQEKCTSDRLLTLHQMAADYYQKTFNGKDPAILIRLAFHAARCRPEQPDSTRYAIIAAEYYLAEGDIRHAIEHYLDISGPLKRGYSLESTEFSRELLFRPGDLLLRIGEVKKSLDWYRSLTAMLEEREEYHLLAELFMKIGFIYFTIGFFERALNNYHSAIAKITLQGEHPLLAVLYGHISRCYLFIGQSDTAREYTEKSIRIIERHDDLGSASEVYLLHGTYLIHCGECSDATKYLLRSLKLKELLNDLPGVGRVKVELGKAHLMLGQPDKSEEYLESAIEIFDAHSSQHDRHSALIHIAQLYHLYSANWERALRIHRDAETFDMALMNPSYEGLRLRNLGNLYADMGLDDKALVCFERCLELFTRLKISLGEARIYHSYGMWYLDQGDLVQAEEFLRKSESLFSSLGFTFHVQRVRLTFVSLAYRKKDYQSARALLENLVPWFETNNYRYELGIALRRQAMVAMELDRLDFARTSLHKSEQIFKFIDSEFELARTFVEISKSFFRADNDSRGNNYAHRAASIFKKIGARKHIESLDSMLQSLRESSVHFLYGIEEKKGEMATLYQMSQYITSILDLKTLSERLIDMVIDSVKAERGLLILTDRYSQDLQIKVARNFSSRSLSTIDDFSRRVVEEVIKKKKPVLTGDIIGDKRFQSNLSVALFDIRSIISVPLIVRDNVIGVIYVDSKDPKNIFTERELNFLVALGNHAAIALDNALLYQKTKSIIEGLRDGLLTINQAGSFLSLNRVAEKLLDIIDSDVVGKDYQLVFAEPWANDLKQLIQMSIDSRSNLENELTFDRPGKKKKHCIVTTSITNNGYGDLTGVSVLLRDVDRIKKLQEEIDLQHRLAAMGELAAKVAHRMKNLLSGIKILSQGLSRECDGQELEAEIVQEMLLEVDAAEKYVYQSLSPSKSLDQTTSATSFSRIVDLVLDQVKTLLKERQVHVIKEISPELPMITINEELMSEAILNLCLNAIEAMNDGGTLTIKIFPEQAGQEIITNEIVPQGVAIEVSDTGSGISEELQTKIFEPFFTTKQKGSGVGLWLVHKLIKSYHGRISIQSAPGAGTTFTIALPLKSENTGFIAPIT